MPAATGFESHSSEHAFKFPIVIIRRFPSFTRWHRHRFPFQFPMNRLRSRSGTLPDVPLASICLSSQVADSVSASSRMLVTYPVRCWLGPCHEEHQCTSRIGSLSCLSKSTMLSLVCLTMVRRAMNVRAHILFFYSDCQRFTLTQKVRCASPSVSNRFKSPGIHRFTADSDNCGKLPLTTTGVRSMTPNFPSLVCWVQPRFDDGPRQNVLAHTVLLLGGVTL